MTTAYSYDNNDRLTQSGGSHYQYDANGNTTKVTLDSDVTTYTYNAKNKLTAASITEGSITKSLAYTYDVDGNRVTSTIDGTTTAFLVDNNQNYAQVVQESVSGTPTVTYTFGDDLLSQERSGQSSFYHYDGLGSTRALSDSTGNVTDSYDYEAFGELLNSAGSTENSYLYTGEQYDEGLGDYYLRARFYSSDIGRFTQMDTWMGRANDPVTLNKYLYANSDGVNWFDPSGNFSLASMSAANNIRNTISGIQIDVGFSLMDAAFATASGDDITPTQYGIGVLLGGVGAKVLGVFSKKLFGQTGGTGKLGSVTCNSFESSTEIHTKSGLKPISKVNIGDLVLTYNELTSEKEYKEVTHIIHEELLKNIVAIELTNGEVIEVTPSHVVYTDGGWGAAGDVKKGQKLNDNLVVDGVRDLEEKKLVFNLTVDGNHNYFVGNSGVLAHNISPCEKTAKIIAVSMPKACAQPFMCKQYASVLKNRLLENGVKGQHLTLIPPPRQFVYSDKFGQIADQGLTHEAIRVGDMVFDNNFPNGVSYQKWWDDLGGSLLDDVGYTLETKAF